jgi:hypothetical protein
MTRPAAHPLFRPVLIASFALAFEIIHAAYPLVVDDAETQAPGELDAVSAVAYVHYRHDWILAFPLEATVALVQRVDASIAFGNQFAEFWENRTRKRSDGFMDTLLAVKAQWLEQERHGLSLSLQAGVKLPTASERKGLGVAASTPMRWSSQPRTGSERAWMPMSATRSAAPLRFSVNPTSSSTALPRVMRPRILLNYSVRSLPSPQSKIGTEPTSCYAPVSNSA